MLGGPKARFPLHLALAFRSDPLGFLTSAVDRYGNASKFRIGKSQFFLLNDPEATRDVLVTQASAFQKSPLLRQAKVSLGEGLLTSEGDFHRRQRKLSQPAFHPSRVAGYGRVMVRRARAMADQWRHGEVVDLHEEMMRLTLQVVTETLFSNDIDQDLDAVGRSMDILVRMFGRARNPLAFILNRLPLSSNRRFIAAQEHVRQTVERFVAQNREAGVDRGDLLSTLVRARDTGGETVGELQASGKQDDEKRAGEIASGAGRPNRSGEAGDRMTDTQLRDEVVTLFAAGHETTANALTFTVWLLAKHPETAERMFAEIRNALADRDPQAADLEKLPFVRAVVAESMRLYPPAWVLMRQAINDVVVAPIGVCVPKDAMVILSQWIAHRDRRWWEEPDRFHPDRWLDETATRARPRYAYFPFGGGVRSCIGESFAWTEAMLLLVTMARTWRFELVDDRPLRLLPTITLRPKDPVRVRLVRRGRG